MEGFHSDTFKLGDAAIQTGTEMVDDPKPDEGKPAQYPAGDSASG